MNEPPVLQFSPPSTSHSSGDLNDIGHNGYANIITGKEVGGLVIGEEIVDGAFESESRQPKLSTSTNSQLHPNSTLSTALSTPPSTGSHSTLSLTESFANENDNNKIRLLYARFEQDGVEGDGFDFGKERSRDGKIETLGKRRNTNDGIEGHRGIKRKSSVATMEVPDKWNRELEVLEHVDRYGFLTATSNGTSNGDSRLQHGRIAILPKSAYGRIPKLKDLRKRPSFAFLQPPNNSRPNSMASSKASSIGLQTEAATFPTSGPAETMKEVERMGKWEKMLKVVERVRGSSSAAKVAQLHQQSVGRQKWKIDEEFVTMDERTKRPTVNAKFRKRVYKGIPDRWRQGAWEAMLEFRTTTGKGKGKNSDGKVEKSDSELEKEFENLIKQSSTHDVQIDLDVPRTITGNIFFHTRYGKGQRALFHVLHSFALHCSTCGYCQGMGPIAATLLCYFEPERAYLYLARLHDVYDLHWIFQPGFPGLIECFYVQERLVELIAPQITEAFATHMISTSAYATKWYITLFVNTVSFKTQLRLWDAFMLEGPDFLIVVSAAIVIGLESSIVSEDASFETILSLLSSFFIIDDEDAFMRWIRKVLQMKGVRKKMEEWRREWKGFVEQGVEREKMT